MSDFSPFFRNRQSSGCSCDLSYTTRCQESVVQPYSRSFNRILAHSSALLLIYPHSRSFFHGDFRFSKQKTQYLFFCAISCSFFNSRKTCVRSIMVNFLFLNHFFLPRGTSAALQACFGGQQRRFGELQRFLREISSGFRRLTHASDHSEKAPDEHKK